jgi:hypothetical protein
VAILLLREQELARDSCVYALPWNDEFGKRDVHVIKYFPKKKRTAEV